MALEFMPLGLYRGKVSHQYGFATAIHKSQITEEVFLSPLGLEGDECADQRHHGGTERALHQYPVEHYDYWRKHYGDVADWCAPGMGENISTEGMLEDSVYLGDRYQWGDAVIEISQPRSPCFKLNKRWGVESLSVDMQKISRCGWLYRVIQPGNVSAKVPLVLLERVSNAMSVRDVCECFFGDPLNVQKLRQLEQQHRLSDSWMGKVIKRLETGHCENWNFRLLGHE